MNDILTSVWVLSRFFSSDIKESNFKKPSLFPGLGRTKYKWNFRFWQDQVSVIISLLTRYQWNHLMANSLLWFFLLKLNYYVSVLIHDQIWVIHPSRSERCLLLDAEFDLFWISTMIFFSPWIFPLTWF